MGLLARPGRNTRAVGSVRRINLVISFSLLEAAVELLVLLGRNTRAAGSVKRITLVISSFLLVGAAGPLVLVDPNTRAVDFAWRSDRFKPVDTHLVWFRTAPVVGSGGPENSVRGNAGEIPAPVQNFVPNGLSKSYLNFNWKNTLSVFRSTPNRDSVVEVK